MQEAILQAGVYFVNSGSNGTRQRDYVMYVRLAYFDLPQYVRLACVDCVCSVHLRYLDLSLFCASCLWGLYDLCASSVFGFLPTAHLAYLDFVHSAPRTRLDLVLLRFLSLWILALSVHLAYLGFSLLLCIFCIWVCDCNAACFCGLHPFCPTRILESSIRRDFQNCGTLTLSNASIV